MENSRPSLLKEIVIEATKENGDLPRMLRLSLVLAAKLNHDPLRLWVRHELEGYRSDAELPAYRIFKCINRGSFITMNFNGELDLPISVLPKELRESFQTTEFRQCISACAELAFNADKIGKTLRVPWPHKLAENFAGKIVQYGQCTSAWQEVTLSDFSGLLDRVKTMALDFALEIDRVWPDIGEIVESNSHIDEKVLDQIYDNTIGNSIHNYPTDSHQHIQAVA